MSYDTVEISKSRVYQESRILPAYGRDRIVFPPEFDNLSHELIQLVY
jgi:hypothetical protein